MIVQGTWLIETSKHCERAYFEDLYEITVPELIKEYELERFEIDPKIKAFVFLEYDGDANKIIRLEEGDKAVVYGEGHYGCPFNTCGMAVLEVACYREVLTRQWVVENSPYQIDAGDMDEWYNFDEFKHPQDLIDYEPLLNGLEPEEVIFVRQL